MTFFCECKNGRLPARGDGVFAFTKKIEMIFHLHYH